jgi:class 3 adenylate cyclase
MTAGPVETEVRKVVTVLFSDITGSTGLGQAVDPESLHELLSRYFAEMKLVVERHGAVVLKFIGDAVMAVFGLPRVCTRTTLCEPSGPRPRCARRSPC